MSAVIFNSGKFDGIGNDGRVVPYGKLYFNKAGTGEAMETFRDSLMSSPNTYPINLSSSGKGDVFLLDSTYDVTLKDKDGVTVWTINNFIPSGGDGTTLGGGYTQQYREEFVNNTGDTLTLSIMPTAELNIHKNGLLLGSDKYSNINETVTFVDSIIDTDIIIVEYIGLSPTENIGLVVSVETIEKMLLLNVSYSSSCIVEHIGTFIYDSEKALINNTLSIFDGWVLQGALVIETVEEIVDLTINDEGRVIFVKDLARGGNFIYKNDEVANDNQGLNFFGSVRQYSGLINVKWFGAKGDGIIDDLPSFNNAINIMQAGQCLFIPDGIYRMSNTLTIDKTIKFQMESSDLNSRLLFDTAITRTVQTTITYPTDGTDAPISTAVSIEAYGVELENIVVDLYVDYNDMSPTNFGTEIDIGIFIKSVAKTILTNCRTRGYWRIAGLYGDVTASNGIIDRTSLYDCRLQGFWSVKIQGAKVKIGETEILEGDLRGSGGASDWNGIRVWLEGWSHHSMVRGSDVDGGCYMVDGKVRPTDSINAIQGRVWLNTRFDGADPYMIKIDNAIRDKFVNSFVDRKTGYLKTDASTGVGTLDCLVSLSANSQHVVFSNTDIYNTTLELAEGSTVEFNGSKGDDLITIGNRSFLPALAFGTGVAYTSRSGSYKIVDDILTFTIEMDVSSLDNTDASQVQITGLNSLINNKYVSANISISHSTLALIPETVVVGMMDGGNLALWKSDGGILTYVDFNISGKLYITGSSNIYV